MSGFQLQMIRRQSREVDRGSGISGKDSCFHRVQNGQGFMNVLLHHFQCVGNAFFAGSNGTLGEPDEEGQRISLSRASLSPQFHPSSQDHPTPHPQ